MQHWGKQSTTADVVNSVATPSVCTNASCLPAYDHLSHAPLLCAVMHHAIYLCSPFVILSETNVADLIRTYLTKAACMYLTPAICCVR